MDAETLSLLRDSGCIQVDFGVESGSDRMLKSIRKGITRAQVLEAFSLCRGFGMRTYANVLLNLPGETAGDIDRTCDLLRRIRPTRLGINLAVPFPGTAIYRRHVHPPLEREEYGIYNHPDLYLDHVDRRFVLAEHALDLKKLRIRIKARFDFFRSLVDWTGNRVFWSVLLRSERKGAYLRVMFSDMVFERLSRAVKIGRHLASGLLGTKTRRSKSSEKRESSG